MASQAQFIGITSAVKSVLTNEWQSSSMIAAQIAFPPDAIARRIESRKRWNKGELNSTVHGNKTHLVAQVIHKIVQQGYAEKRYADGGRCEYRLAQPKPEQD